MYQVNDIALFSSFTEAKLDLISKINRGLNASQISDQTKDALLKWAEVVQKSIDNHSKDISEICLPYAQLNENVLIEIEPFISSQYLQSIKKSPYGFVPIEESVSDILIRANESALPVLLLKKPTPAMKENVKAVSDKIINLCNRYQDCGYDYNALAQSYGKPTNSSNFQFEEQFKKFAFNLMHHVPDTNHTGGFTLEEINAHLSQKGIVNILPQSDVTSLTMEQAEAIIALNLSALADNENLERVMYIHYTFAHSLMRFIPLFELEEHEPTGKLKEIVETQFQNKEQFFTQLQDPTDNGIKARKYISDNHIYFSDYFAADQQKGRKGGLDFSQTTNCYGLFNFKQIEQLRTEGSPLYHTNEGGPGWASDVVAQKPDLSSLTVKEYAKNETAYISGPSGTFSLQIALYEMLVNAQDIKDKQIYLQSVYAYIVGTGLHSTHEVLGPAQSTMSLIPNYIAEKLKKSTDMSAPNFGAYFELAAKNDPDFKERLDQARSQVVEFYQKVYQKYPEKYSNEKLLKKILEEYEEDSHDKYADQLQILINNNVLSTSENKAKSPIVYAMATGKNELVNFLAQLDRLKQDRKSQELVSIYNEVKSVEDSSEFFVLEFDPKEETFSFSGKQYYDEDTDDYNSHNVDDHLDEIDSFLDKIGLKGLSVKGIQSEINSIKLSDVQQQILWRHFTKGVAADDKLNNGHLMENGKKALVFSKMDSKQKNGVHQKTEEQVDNSSVNKPGKSKLK